jgi:hypothetical protein
VQFEAEESSFPSFSPRDPSFPNRDDRAELGPGGVVQPFPTFEIRLLNPSSTLMAFPHPFLRRLYSARHSTTSQRHMQRADSAAAIF